MSISLPDALKSFVDEPVSGPKRDLFPSGYGLVLAPTRCGETGEAEAHQCQGGRLRDGVGQPIRRTADRKLYLLARHRPTAISSLAVTDRHNRATDDRHIEATRTGL